MIRKLLDKTFLKFVLVGIVNTLVGSAIMFLCYNLLRCSYWFSSAMNYVVGSIVSYFLNKYFTFQNKERNWRIVVKFIINICICYLIAYGGAKPLVAHLLIEQPVAIQENVAMLIGMVLFVILNYFGQKFFAFRTTAADHER